MMDILRLGALPFPPSLRCKERNELSTPEGITILTWSLVVIPWWSWWWRFFPSLCNYPDPGATTFGILPICTTRVPETWVNAAVVHGLWKPCSHMKASCKTSDYNTTISFSTMSYYFWHAESWKSYLANLWKIIQPCRIALFFTKLFQF